jgi:peptidoglycan LD-endopeptidase LytH
MVTRIGYIVVIAVLMGLAALFYGGINQPVSSNEVIVRDTAVVNPAGPKGLMTIPSVTVGPGGLAIPVAGVKARELVDTFTQARAGGARVHDAIDIMAATGTPIVSVAPGTVEKLYFSNGGGGTSVYVRSPDGFYNYYYAHLSAYAPGLHEGQRVRRGTPIGYVGFSGNANPAGPHLHFAINRMAPGQKWYDGTPINPYPLLAGKSARR